MHYNIKIHVPRAHEVKNQRVIVKRTSQIMKYGQDVIIQQMIISNKGSVAVDTSVIVWRDIILYIDYM